MDKLLEFYLDRNMTEAVRDFFVSVLEEEAVSRVMNKEDVSGIADAKSVILKSFDRLDDIYKQQSEKEPINQSR